MHKRRWTNYEIFIGFCIGFGFVRGSSRTRYINPNLDGTTTLISESGTFTIFDSSAAENNGQESTYFVVEAQQIDFLLPEAPTRGGVR